MEAHPPTQRRAAYHSEVMMSRRLKNRRTPTMAKVMRKVRAVYLSEDFQPYWRVHVARGHGRS
jgi:hypothetical protein